MPYGTKIVYKGHILKSKVELAWAQLFDVRAIPWEYEPIRFRDPHAPEGKGHTYTPDFGLYGGMFYVETKSYGSTDLNRFHFCTKPLLIIFGYPDRYYIRVQRSSCIARGHFTNWEEAFTEVRT